MHFVDDKLLVHQRPVASQYCPGSFFCPSTWVSVGVIRSVGVRPWQLTLSFLVSHYESGERAEKDIYWWEGSHTILKDFCDRGTFLRVFGDVHEIMTFFLMPLDLNIEESNDRSTWPKSNVAFAAANWTVDLMRKKTAVWSKVLFYFWQMAWQTIHKK